jgi:hypothetical protein
VLIIVVMYCMRAELQNMNNKGSMVNASSIAGIMGFPKNAAYTASKHGKPTTPRSPDQLLIVILQLSSDSRELPQRK